MRKSGGKYFSIRPQSNAQLILGTNGSGKSSLARELSPLPADSKDFSKEGSKTIEITHRGFNYTLKSWFTHGAKHSFLKDGEELNPGGTTRVQLELVKQEFNYTPELHKLMLGEDRFTRMKPLERRERFTQMSDQNYDYALGLFRRLKEKHRDISGALKLAKKRLVIEVASVITKEEKARLQAEVYELDRQMQAIVEQRVPMDKDLSHYEMVQEEILVEIEQLTARILRSKLIVPHGTDYRSIQEVNEAIEHYRHKVTELETLINAKTVDFTKLQKDAEALRATGQAGLDELQAKLEVLRGERNEALSKRKLQLEGWERVTNAANAFDSVYETLLEVFSTIPENSDYRFSQAKFTEATDALVASKDRILVVTSELQKLVGTKNHLEAHKANGDIACPNCNHRWIPNFSDAKYAMVLAQIADKEDELGALKDKVHALEEQITEIREYGTKYRAYTNCVTSWRILNPFWDYLQDNELVRTSPRQAMTLLDVLRNDFKFELEAHAVEQKMDDVKNLINIANQVGDANLSDVSTKLDIITGELENYTSELRRTRQGLNDNVNYQKQVTELTNLWELTKAELAKSGANNMNVVTAMKNKFLNEALASLRSTLLIKQDVLHEAELKEHTVYDLQNSINTLELEEEAAKLLVKELSPTDGLIAEGLLGFINTYTRQMNAVIRRVWSYPLQILPVKLEEDGEVDLDYKFPMMVQDTTNVVDDVSCGSTGMLEIVDLAYKVVAMRYHGIADFPLIIDEFGASFDEAHRTSSMHAVKNLMETTNFTQLFMVSHYESIYGAFTNAEMCVLCDSNITVPAGRDYNQHVRIE